MIRTNTLFYHLTGIFSTHHLSALLQKQVTDIGSCGCMVFMGFSDRQEPKVSVTVATVDGNIHCCLQPFDMCL